MVWMLGATTQMSSHLGQGSQPLLIESKKVLMQNGESACMCWTDHPLLSLGAVLKSRRALSLLFQVPMIVGEGQKEIWGGVFSAHRACLGRPWCVECMHVHTLLPRVTSSGGSLPRKCLHTLMAVNLEKINL